MQKVGGIGQIACSGIDDLCSEVFIGDYFGLAISQNIIYPLFVSTHYPSNVTADGGGRVYYRNKCSRPSPAAGSAQVTKPSWRGAARKRPGGEPNAEPFRRFPARS